MGDDTQLIDKIYPITSYKVRYIPNNSNEELSIDVPNEKNAFLQGHELKRKIKEYIKKNTGFEPNKILNPIEEQGHCLLCGDFQTLQKSHVIGKTIFNSLLKSAPNGQAYKVSQNKIEKSGDNWVTKMLCSKCENRFNQQFENYAVEVLRSKRNEVIVSKSNNDVTFSNIDAKKIALYLLSIYWRGALSTHESYNELKINYGISNYLKNCFLGKYSLNNDIFKMRISKLFDESKVLSENAMKFMIPKPFARLIDEGLIYCFIYEGYFFQIFINCKNVESVKNLSGIIDLNSSELKIPYIDLFSIDPIKLFLQNGFRLASQDKKLAEALFIESYKEEKKL
jgi:hypothetical protein